jgi:hypothetical protein
MAEDNTPLIAAISAVDAQRRRRVEDFVDKMIGEAHDEEMMNRLYPEASGRGLPVDSAVFYYPGLDTGIVVYGPISVDDMLKQFFRVNLPGIMPDAAQFKNVPVKELARTSLNAGMVVLFGEAGRLNQVMSKRGRANLPDSGSTAEDVFDSAETHLAHITAPGVISSAPVTIGEILPQLKWLASAE